jgi:multidrug efflux pump subunit AcrA (membrane-fusion protein)
MTNTKQRFRLTVGLGALILPVIVCLGCSGKGATEEEEKSALPDKPVPIQAATVERTTLKPSLDLVGTIAAVPERTVSLSAQLGGWVEKVNVFVGQKVRTGTVLLTLDARLADADLAHAKALEAEKRAVLARLKRGYLPHELDVARKQRDKALADMEALKGELAALRPLLMRNELSPVQFDTKAKTLKAAEAALSGAEAHLQLLEAGTPHELIDEAQAQLDAASAGLQRAKLARDWCVITSPIEGVITQLPARQGQFFDRAAPLATVMDLSEVLVHLRIPNANFTSVSPGTKVDVRVLGTATNTYHGVITRINGEADPLTGNIDVFAAIKNPGSVLRPGLGCRARLWLPEIPNAVVVPTNAIADHSGTSVVTLIRDNKVSEVKVEVGAEASDRVQVLKGLTPGDIVATVGGYGLPDGCPVEIVPAPGSKKQE